MFYNPLEKEETNISKESKSKFSNSTIIPLSIKQVKHLIAKN